MPGQNYDNYFRDYYLQNKERINKLRRLYNRRYNKIQYWKNREAILIKQREQRKQRIMDQKKALESTNV